MTNHKHKARTEYSAKRDPNRCPTHPGELLEDIIPATHKTKTEITYGEDGRIATVTENINGSGPD